MSSAVVLVHGWGAGRFVMAPLGERLAADHQVISLDLRGYGGRPAPPAGWPLGGYADDVIAAIDARGLGAPVVVGHSMGGLIALDVAARYGDRIAGAAILESPVIAPPALVAGTAPLLAALRTPRWREAGAGFMRAVAGGELAPEHLERLIQAITSLEQRVLVEGMEAILVFDGAAAAAQVTCPLLYASTGAPYTDLERLRALCPQVVVRQVPGGGHYFPLEAPGPLARAVAQFVEGIAQPGL